LPIKIGNQDVKVKHGSYDGLMTRAGAELALLLLAGFRTFADRGSEALARRGFDDVRPAHDFALRAIAAGADTPSELARRLTVTRQAAAKTIAVLEERRYIERRPDPTDGRRLRLTITERGEELMQAGDAVFAELRADWEAQVGRVRIAEAEEALRALVGDGVISVDSPDWSTRDLDS
jgi:DNA-binding MarR family transcriptional regulator